ncbi:MAG: hypothetical protein DI605_05405 [Sphingomonas sp.]|nr:MAG: hypothetical protein DI605_05405 [Sphingomonas sp.]
MTTTTRPRARSRRRRTTTMTTITATISNGAAKLGAITASGVSAATVSTTGNVSVGGNLSASSGTGTFNAVTAIGNVAGATVTSSSDASVGRDLGVTRNFSAGSIATSGNVYAPSGLATLGNITTPGYLQVFGTASFGDLSYYAQLLSGNPLLNFSPGNYLLYDRTTNAASINIGSAPRLSVTATGVSIPGDLAFQTTSSNINGATSQLADAGSVVRTLQARIGERTSVLDFCPSTIGAGSTDATSCIQAAITALCARSNKGGILFFPPGAYLINGTVLLPCAGLTIEGAGVGNPYGGQGTQIIAGHRTDSAPVIRALVTSYTSAAGEANAPSSQAGTQRFSFGPVIRNLSFANLNGSVPNGRPGPFVELNYTTYSLLDHVTMYAACTGLKIYGGFFVGVRDSQIEGFAGNCNVIDLHGDRSKTYSTLDAVYFDKVEITNFGGAGSCYNISDRVQTVWWTNTTCQTGGFAINSACPGMSSLQDCPGFFTLSDFEAESNGTSASLINITELADGFTMTGSWLRGYYSGDAANTLISITPGLFPSAQRGLPITISNNWLKHAGGSCLYIQNEQATISGNHIYGCGRRADGPSYAAVEIRANYATISNNILCGGDYLNDSSSFATGVLLANNANYISITGNIIGSACTSIYLNPGTGTSIASAGNAGP